MMQAADLRDRDHLSFGWMLDSTWHRCITFQRKMSARLVIVRKVARENACQVSPVEHDDVIQEFSADTADQRSTYGFCHGDRGAVMTSSMSMFLIRFSK